MSKLDVYERLFRYHTLEEYLDFCAFNQLHSRQYKPFNCALIMAQRPGATYVQTERAWNRAGFEIKPEATPIVIMQISGPVTLVYDREDVYSSETQLSFPEIDFMDATRSVDEHLLTHWILQVNKKGIRVAESRMGGRLYGTAQPLASPFILSYTEIVKGKPLTKRVEANHQVTLNSNLNTHEKALTMLHELGHLYCGHISGKCNKTNSLPAYRFEKADRETDSLCSELSEIEQEMAALGKEQASERYQLLNTRREELEQARKIHTQQLEDQQEYEAQLVCKLLCQRNQFTDHKSDAYLKQHSPGGSLPAISLPSVLEAVERIAGILDI
ncbi:MAG: hypothetical protein IJ906_14310 [Oscillospiraceae bacterium]|nr:hypothetical protein [Oscillospiraceae bacterium]